MGNNNNILYLCNKYPYPKLLGEDYAYAQHLDELFNSKYASETLLLFCNTSQKNGKFPYEENIKYKIFQPKYILNKYTKLFVYLFANIFCKFPYNMTKFITKEYVQYLKTLSPKIVILDSIYGMAMLPKTNNYKLIYIEHNYEYELAISNAKLQSNILNKMYYYLLAFKMNYLEKELIKRSEKIVCISSSDYKHFEKVYPQKTVFIPSKADVGNFSWKGSDIRTLFFCGPIGHYPNMEAIDWIVNVLAPNLSLDIKIKIAGKGTDELPKEWERENVEFLGFISQDELCMLYQSCNAFICPIVYGSGIKIKITEAISYGMPVIATKESLEGLEYMNIKPLINRNNLKQTIENIENLLNNRKLLESFSNDLINQFETYYQNNNLTIENIIDDVY